MMDIKEDFCGLQIFDKKSASLTNKSVSGSGVNIPLELNKKLDDLKLAKQLHKSIIRKF